MILIDHLIQQIKIKKNNKPILKVGFYNLDDFCNPSDTNK